MGSDAGRRWIVAPPAPEALRAALPDLHPVVLQVLYTRGLATPEAARAFLAGAGAPLHDPRQLYGMDRAIARLRRAREEGETVAVHGDFDVDGVAATAILSEGLRASGARVISYLPQRTTTGYGLVPETVARMAEEGASVVVTGDTGTRAGAAVARAAELGVDVVVTDHHLPGPDLPPALALVNPHQPACPYPFKDLAGAGVAWKLIEALALEGVVPPGVPEALLDLVALGTIVDVAPLQGENRVLVQQGLRRLAATTRPGLRALLGASGRAVDEHLVAFVVGPRLNAAGRMDDPNLALELLLTRDEARAGDLVRILEEKNAERQRLTQSVLQVARQQAATLAGDPVIVLRGSGWPGGVIGLVAARIADEMGRPAFVVDVGEEACRGSGRGGPGVDLVAMLAACDDLLLEYGGHAGAAGFAAPAAHLEALVARLRDLGAGEVPVEAPPAVADQALAQGELDWALYRALLPLRPFGHGNPAPTFYTPDLPVVDLRVVGAGGRHLRARVRFGKEVLTAFGPELGPLAGGISRRGRLDALFSLDESNWNGYESLELRLLDVRPSVTAAPPVPESANG
jgi:single-stranded-DNA-specific exonuclease